MDYSRIEKRYSELAESACCLSCGGAVNYAEPATGEICIDLGSGRGNDAIRMAEKTGPSGFVYGIDISEGMIARAVSTAHRLGIKNVKFINSSLENLPLENSTADLVISNCTINHAGNKQQVWNEIFRILKPGGRFVVSDIYSSEPVPEEYRNDPVAVSECWAGSVTREEYLMNLTVSGFISHRILEESDPYPKGKITVSSWTVTGIKPGKDCGCSNKLN